MPVSSHPDRERAPIVFGHKTALAILRSAAPRTLPPVAGKARVLPSRAPARGEVEAAIEHLEASYPDLRLERPAHVLVGSAALGRPSKAVKSHLLTVPLSGTSFYRLGDGVFACVPALAFVQEAARGKSLVAMLELGYELCGTYRTRRTGAAAAYGVEPLASVRSLGGYAARNASVDGARKVGRALRYLADGSAYTDDREHVRQLALWMYERVDVICASWDISLAVPEDEYPFQHEDEILAPMREAGSSALDNYYAHVGEWEPQEP